MHLCVALGIGHRFSNMAVFFPSGECEPAVFWLPSNENTESAKREIPPC